jgi:3',5'-cyclic AMP phosphodiesterase CpdA
VVVLMHYPVFSAGKDRDNPEMRDLLLPLFDKYGVDLVLQGHDHVYARTHKLHGGKVAGPSAPGTVYVISAGGFKTYPVNPRHKGLMAVLDSGRQYYQVIDVSPERLEYRSYAVDGQLNDAFRLEKNASGPSTFIDLSGGRGAKPKPGAEGTPPEGAQSGRPAA